MYMYVLHMLYIYQPGRWRRGTDERRDSNVDRPKNLATKVVAFACAAALSIHWMHGRSTQLLLHPFLSTLHPLQLILYQLFSFQLFAQLSLYVLSIIRRWSTLGLLQNRGLADDIYRRRSGSQAVGWRWHLMRALRLDTIQHLFFCTPPNPVIERQICRPGLDERMRGWIGSREGVVRDYVRVYGLNAYNLVFRRDEIWTYLWFPWELSYNLVDWSTCREPTTTNKMRVRTSMSQKNGFQNRQYPWERLHLLNGRLVNTFPINWFLN